MIMFSLAFFAITTTTVIARPRLAPSSPPADDGALPRPSDLAVGALSGDRIDYSIVDQPISDIVAAINERSHASIKLGPGARARLAGVHLQGTLREVLDQISGASGLVWIAIGRDVYMSTKSEVTTKMLRAGAMSEADLQKFKDVIGLYGSGGGIFYARSVGLVRLFGPSGFVEAAEQALSVLTPSTPRVAAVAAGKPESDTDQVTVIRYGSYPK